MKKMLVVYYSWSNGNTKRIAEKLADATGADLARIETVKPYEGTYDEVVSQGEEEVKRGYMPEIKPLNVKLDDYSVVAVGTPTWWYTMAPAVHTFLHSQKWEGKKVILFMTNGGWPGHVIKDMEKECRGADVVLTKEIRFDSSGGDTMITPENEVEAFVTKAKKILDEEA